MDRECPPCSHCDHAETVYVDIGYVPLEHLVFREVRVFECPACKVLTPVKTGRQLFRTDAFMDLPEDIEEAM